MLAKTKLNSIETLISQALIDMEKSWRIYRYYEGKNKYEKMKENVKNVSEQLEDKSENIRLNCVNSKN